MMLIHISWDLRDHLRFMITLKLRASSTFKTCKKSIIKHTKDSNKNAKKWKTSEISKENSSDGKKRSKTSSLNIILCSKSRIISPTWMLWLCKSNKIGTRNNFKRYWKRLLTEHTLGLKRLRSRSTWNSRSSSCRKSIRNLIWLTRLLLRLA